MHNEIKKGQVLLQRMERQLDDVRATMAEFHELAAGAVKDHGKKVGLDDSQIAAIIIPKNPK